MKKNLSKAVRKAEARDRVTAVPNEDLVVVLGSFTSVSTAPVGTVGTIEEGTIKAPACNKPHVEYPTSA